MHGTGMRDDPGRSRFELEVDGEVAYADYRRRPCAAPAPPTG